jgi:hypothetical protein
MLLEVAPLTLRAMTFPSKWATPLIMVLYTPALGEETVKYAVGRDLLVLVGKNTITYNDILGRSFAVPIESRRPAAKPNQSKSVSPAGGVIP